VPGGETTEDRQTLRLQSQQRRKEAGVDYSPVHSPWSIVENGEYRMGVRKIKQRPHTAVLVHNMLLLYYC